jgi:hypothetical protein
MQHTYIFRIYENEVRGSEVGFVLAEDKDSTEFNHHTYSFLAPPDSPFEIGLRSGRITTNQHLDREQQEVYTLAAVVIDTSEPYYSSSVTVTVYVMDRNDNPPRFTFPTSNNNTIYISNSVPVGYIVTTVHAEDNDGNRYGQVRYEMVHSMGQQQYLEVEPDTGTVTLVSSVSHIDNVTFTLTIIASDSGDHSMSTSARLHIIIGKTLTVSLTTNIDNVMSNIVITLVACASGIFIVILMLTICVLCHRRCHYGNQEKHHKSQMEAPRVLSIDELAQLSHRYTVDKVEDNNIGSNNTSTINKTMPLCSSGMYDCHDNSITSVKLEVVMERSMQQVSKLMLSAI